MSIELRKSIGRVVNDQKDINAAQIEAKKLGFPPGGFLLVLLREDVKETLKEAEKSFQAGNLEIADEWLGAAAAIGNLQEEVVDRHIPYHIDLILISDIRQENWGGYGITDSYFS